MELTEAVEVKYVALAKGLGLSNPQIIFDDDDGEISVRIEDEDKGNGGMGFISDFPECCGIGILMNASADSPELLKLIFQLREEIAQTSNWGLLMQTHVADHEPTRTIMRQLGWRHSTSQTAWHNPNSGNKVTIWTKKIHQPKPRIKPEVPSL